MLKTKDYLVVDCADLQNLIIDKYNPKSQSWVGNGEGFDDGWEGVIGDLIGEGFLGNYSWATFQYEPDGRDEELWGPYSETEKYIQRLYTDGEIPKDKEILVQIWW